MDPNEELMWVASVIRGLIGNQDMLSSELLQGSREMSSIRRISDIEASPSKSGDEWSFVGLKAGF